MDESLVPLDGSISDLSSLSIENLTSCVRSAKCFDAAWKTLNQTNARRISESTLLSIRDHLVSRMPALCNTIFGTFAPMLSGGKSFVSVSACSENLEEIREKYGEVLRMETTHSGCNACKLVYLRMENVFDRIKDMIVANEKAEETKVLSAFIDGSSEINCKSDDMGSDNQLRSYGCLEESIVYPELQTSIALSRYSELSHTEDWRFYFEESIGQSVKEQLSEPSLARSKSAQPMSMSMEHPARPLSTDDSPAHLSIPHVDSLNDRFRWDEYDLKQPLVGNNDPGKRLSSSHSNLTYPIETGKSPAAEFAATSFQTPPPPPVFNNSDKKPVKIDGLSAEILAATIRRLRIAEQRVSVLETYNDQLRDDNHSMVKRLRQQEDLVANLRKELLSNTETTAKQLEEVIGNQMSSLKAERDSLAETVERLKPLEIQLAGSNFEKKLLQEAVDEGNKLSSQLKRERETLESTIFQLQSLVQRQRQQINDADIRNTELSELIEDITVDKDATIKRLADSEKEATLALQKADGLNNDLKRANQAINNLNKSLENREYEIASEKNRLEKEHADAVDELKRQMAEDVRAREEALKNEMQQLRVECSKLVDESKAIENERTSSLLYIKRIHEREMDDIYDNHIKELAKVRSEMAEKSETAITELREEVEAAHAAELAEVKAKYEEQLRDIREQHDSAQQANQENLKVTLQNYESAVKHSQQIERESNEAIERLSKELQMALENQSKMLNSVAEQENIMANMRQRIDTQNQELEAAILDRSDLLSQIDQLKQSLESFTEGQVAAAVDNVRSETEIQIEQLSGQLELAKRQLDDTHQLLVMAGQHNADLRMALQSQQQSYLSQIEQQKSLHAVELSSLKQVVDALKSQVESDQQNQQKLLEQNRELEIQLASARPIAESKDVGCSTELDNNIFLDIESQNKALSSQLAVLNAESKNIQTELEEMHAAEMERAEAIHQQKMEELRISMQIQINDVAERCEKKLQDLQSELDRKSKSIQIGEEKKENVEVKFALLKQQFELDREEAVMKERDSLLEDHAQVIRKLKTEWNAEVAKWQSDLESARHTVHSLTEERNLFQKNLEVAADEKKDLTAKIEQYSHELATQRSEFSRQIENEHQDLKNEFEKMLSTVSSKLEMEGQLKRANAFIDFQQRIDAKVTELVALQEQHKAAMSKAEDRICELQALCEKYLEEKLELEQKSSREKADLRQQIDNLTSSSSENLRKTIKETEDRLAEVHKEEINSLMLKADDRRRTEISEISARYEAEIKQLSEQLNVKMERQLQELSHQTHAIDSAVTNSYREKMAKEIAQIERNLALEFRQRESEAHLEFDRAHEVELAHVESSWQRRCLVIEEQLARKNEECRKALEELEQVQETAKRMAELMASDYEQQVKLAAEQAAEKAKTEAEQIFAKQKDDFKHEIQSVRDSVESFLQEEVNKWRGQTQDLDLKIESLEKLLENASKARDDAIEAAKLASNEVVFTSSQTLGVFRLLTQLVKKLQALIMDKTDNIVARPASDGLIEALALIRATELPHLNDNDESDMDIARPFQEVQIWIEERIENLLDLVDAALIQSELDHDFVSVADRAVRERDIQLETHRKSLESAEKMLAEKDREIAKLQQTSSDLASAVEKLDAELKENQTREFELLEERNADIEYHRQLAENKCDVSIQGENVADQVAEVEAMWSQRCTELDAAARATIEDFKRQMATAEQRIDELQAAHEKIRIDYDHQITDQAQNISNKEHSLKSLRKFLDEQAAEREAEQEEYQKTILGLQQTLSERQRALEVAQNKISAIDDVQRELEENSRQLAVSQERMTELQGLLAETEDRLRCETGRFQSRLQSAQAEKLRLENEVSRAKAVITKLEARLGSSLNSSGDCIDNSFTLDRVKQELNETRLRWEAQSTKIEHLESELKLLREEKEDCHIKMDELKNQLEESQKRLVEAENACSQALSQFQVDIGNRESTIANLQADLADRDVQLHTLETTSRNLMSERDQSTAGAQYLGNNSPSLTINSFSNNSHDRDREIEQLRSLVDKLTFERDQQVEIAKEEKKLLEDRLTSLENQVVSQQQQQRQQEAEHNVSRNLSIIAADLSQELAVSDRLDEALLRRAGADIDNPTPRSQNEEVCTGLVTPSNSGDSKAPSPTGSGSIAVILHRLEDVSSEILRLSDLDTLLLSGAAESSSMADRLQAVIEKISPQRPENDEISEVLNELKSKIGEVASHWSFSAEQDGSNQKKFSDFINDVSHLLDAAIDQVVSVLVNHNENQNVDSVRQLCHVTTQLSSDFSATERQALTDDCQTMAQRVRQMESESSRDKKQLAEANKQLEEFDEKLRLQSGELEHLRQELEKQQFNASSICDQLRSQLDESYAEIERARRQSDVHYASINELEETKRSNESLQNEIRQRQAEIDRFEMQIAGIKQAFTTQLARDASELEAQREKASRLQVELNDSKRSLDIAVQDRDRLQQEVERLLGILAKQEKLTAEVNDKFIKAEEELKASRFEYSRLEMRISAKTDATLRNVKESMMKLDAEKEQLRQELVTSEKRSSSMAHDLERALATSSHSEERIAALSHQLDSRLAEVSRLSSRLTELEAAGITASEFGRLKDRLQARDAACERAMEQSATLRARLTELTTRLTPLRTQMLLAAARANSIAASISNSVVLGSSEYKSANSMSVSVASQLESMLRLAATELDQLMSPVTSSSNGAAVFSTEDALSPPPLFESNGDDDKPPNGRTDNRQQIAKLLAQNRELGDTIYELSVELRQAQRHATNEQFEKKHQSDVSQLRQQLRELTAKYVRAEGHRKALVYQKRYLMLVIGDFRDTERQILVKLKAMDTSVDRSYSKSSSKMLPKSWHQRASAHLASMNKPAVLSGTTASIHLSPLARFRAAASSIIFVHRTKKLSKKWRKFSGANSSNELPKTSMSMYSSANIRPKAAAKTEFPLPSSASSMIGDTQRPSSRTRLDDFALTNEDVYLSRLESVRNQLRECRSASGAAVQNAFPRR